MIICCSESKTIAEISEEPTIRVGSTVAVTPVY